MNALVQIPDSSRWVAALPQDEYNAIEYKRYRSIEKRKNYESRESSRKLSFRTEGRNLSPRTKGRDLFRADLHDSWLSLPHRFPGYGLFVSLDVGTCACLGLLQAADLMASKMNILGISAYYHDSAAALMADGDILTTVQEELFSRKKHDARFPVNAIECCLKETNITLSGVDLVVFYDKPLVKFERLLETYLSYAAKRFRSFLAAMPVWLKEKLFLKMTLKRELAALGGCAIPDLPQPL